MGLTVSLLALSRSTYSFLFLICVPFLLFIKPGKETLVLFLAPILLLHGGWCLKNYVVYGNFSIVTSTWKGISAAKGLLAVKKGDDFKKSILSNKESHPKEFIRLIETHGIVHLYQPADFSSYFSDDVNHKDQLISARLNNLNRPHNSIKTRVLSDWHSTAYLLFAFNRPDIIFNKLIESYIKFWEPIRNYSNKFIGLFFIKPVIKNSFNFISIFKGFIDNSIPEKTRMMAGKYIRFLRGNTLNKGANIRTIPYLPLLALIFNILSIHVLLPVYLALFIISLFGSKIKTPLKAEHLLMTMLYIYVAFVSNLLEHGENMRFRLDIEPIIWILSFFLMLTTLGKVRQLFQAFKTKSRKSLSLNSRIRGNSSLGVFIKRNNARL